MNKDILTALFGIVVGFVLSYGYVSIIDSHIDHQSISEALR